MKFNPPLQAATLLRRYKRFLTDIELASGEQVTIHCPNTGSMQRCIVEGSNCWYSVSDNPKRKYSRTWEIATAATGHLAGINTGRANNLVREAIENQLISTLAGYETIRSEVKYGNERSRIDFLLSTKHKPDCYVEVKSVTLGMEDGRGLFPDAVSARGTKHLRELMTMVKQGNRAVLIFCVQHNGILSVAPADNIDHKYGQALREAIAVGVDVIAYKAQVSPDEITLSHTLPVVV